jgi:hypothetical protein
MSLPIQTTFRHATPNPEIEKSIRSRSEKLARLFPRIDHMKVVIEAPRRRPQAGCRVSLSIAVPGRELVVHTPRHEDLGRLDAVLCEAFHAIRRELETYTSRRKAPPTPATRVWSELRAMTHGATG